MHLVVQDTFYGASSIPGRSLLIDKFNVTIQHSQTLLGMLYITCNVVYPDKPPKASESLCSLKLLMSR